MERNKTEKEKATQLGHGLAIPRHPGAWARAKEVHLVDGEKSLRAGM